MSRSRSTSISSLLVELDAPAAASEGHTSQDGHPVQADTQAANCHGNDTQTHPDAPTAAIPAVMTGEARLALLQYGPLPKGWYFAIHGQNVVFRSVAGATAEGHPVAAYNANLRPFENNSTAVRVKGFLHPHKYQHSDWKWVKYADYHRAVQLSLQDRLYHSSGRGFSQDDLDDQVSQYRIQHPRTRAPREPYHPADRGNNMVLKPDEAKAAAIVHWLGHSLVIFDCPALSSLEPMLPEGGSPLNYGSTPIVTRFSLSGESESMPPLHLGFFLGE